MDLAESMLKYVIEFVLRDCKDEIEFLNNFVEKGLLDKLNKLVNDRFDRITYTDAVDILLKSGKKFEYRVEWGIDLQSEHERYLTEEYF